MAKVAGSIAGTHHVACSVAPFADAAGLGQLGGAQDTGDGAVAVRPGGDAAVHAAIGELAQYGGGSPTDPQASCLRRPSSSKLDGVDGVVGGDSARMESAADTVHLEWEASRAAQASETASLQWLSGRHLSQAATIPQEWQPFTQMTH